MRSFNTLEEFDSMPDAGNSNPETDNNSEVGKLVKVTVTFLCLWQSVYGISDKALDILLRFLASLVKALASNASSVFVTIFASLVPSSIFMLRKHANLRASDQLIEYVVCPA